MKRLVYPKVFTRREEMDFSDDGNYFKGYKYKDILPITSLNADGNAYISIRLDYLGYAFELYREDDSILDAFNGVPTESVDMDELIKNCEYIIEKYINNPEVSKRNDRIKAQQAIENAEYSINACTYDVEVAKELIIFLNKKKALAEKYGRFFSDWDMKTAERELASANEKLSKAVNRKALAERMLQEA